VSTRSTLGALADRQLVYARQEWDGDDPATYLMEIGSDGRRIRQVEVARDGSALKTDTQDWPFNPPLVDPLAPLRWASPRSRLE
jgi:hypothetical protein